MSGAAWKPRRRLPRPPMVAGGPRRGQERAGQVRPGWVRFGRVGPGWVGSGRFRQAGWRQAAIYGRRRACRCCPSAPSSAGKGNGATLLAPASQYPSTACGLAVEVCDLIRRAGHVAPDGIKRDGPHVEEPALHHDEIQALAVDGPSWLVRHRGGGDVHPRARVAAARSGDDFDRGGACLFPN